MTTFHRIGLELTLTCVVITLMLGVAWVLTGLAPDVPQSDVPAMIPDHIPTARAERWTWPSEPRRAKINIWTELYLVSPENHRVLEDRPGGITVFVSGDTIIERVFLHQTADGQWHPPFEMRPGPDGQLELSLGGDVAPRWVWRAIEELNRQGAAPRQSAKSE